MGGDAAAEADPQHQHQQQLADRVQQTFHRRASRRNKGQERRSRGRGCRRSEHLLPRRHPVHPKAEIEVLVETAGLGARTDVAESGHLAAADGAAESQRVEILEGRAGVNPNFLTPSSGSRRSRSCDIRNGGSVGRSPERFQPLVPPLRWLRPAGRTVVRRSLLCCRPIDSIDDNSRR